MTTAFGSTRGIRAKDSQLLLRIDAFRAATKIHSHGDDDSRRLIEVRRGQKSVCGAVAEVTDRKGIGFSLHNCLAQDAAACSSNGVA